MDASLLTVLVNFRTPALTLRAVEALLEATGGMPNAHAVIVENGSADDSLNQLQKGVRSAGWEARVTVIDSGRNGGFGAGCNVGIRHGLAMEKTPDYFYMLNSDAFADGRTVTELVDFMQSHPRAGIAGGLCFGEDTGDRSTAFRFPSWASELDASAGIGVLTRVLETSKIQMPIPKEPVRCDWVTGASLMLSREAIETVGMFDEGFFLYFEETDLCRRVLDAGLEVWSVPASRVMHLGGASTGSSIHARPSIHWFNSRRRYLSKHHGAAYAAGADAARVAGHFAHLVYRRITGRKPASPQYFLKDLLSSRK